MSSYLLSVFQLLSHNDLSDENKFKFLETYNTSCLNYVIYREKVDLTQYIEEHSFVFDQVFDQFVTNEQVGFALN